MFNVQFPPGVNVTGQQLALAGRLTDDLLLDSFHPKPTPSLECHVASTIDDFLAIQDLRRLVFYADVEGELEDEMPAYLYEENRFDEHCDHLVIRDQSKGKIVASCRLQSGLRTLEGMEFSAAQEFDLEPLDRHCKETTEFSLMCLHPEYDSDTLLELLYQGMLDYARHNKGRYLLGCVPLESHDAAVGTAVFAALGRHHLASLEWQTSPWLAWACPLCSMSATAAEYPQQLRHHLARGAKICAPPAIDRRFDTVSFLVMHDLEMRPVQSTATVISRPVLADS